MLKKTPVIIFFLVLAFIAFIIYQQVKIPDGVTPLSDSQETIQWLSFWGGVAGLVTAALGVIEKIIELVIKLKGKKKDV